MRIEELEVVCQEAARNLVQRATADVPATVVLPLPSRTSVTALADWPDDPEAQTHLLQRFADDVATANNASCYGFIAEGVAADEAGAPVTVVLVAFGARNHHPRVTAAPMLDEGLGEFAPSEPLAPAALPFLAPLQRAVDRAAPPDAFSG